MEPFTIKVHLTKKQYRVLIMKNMLTRPLVLVLLCIFSLMAIVNSLNLFIDSKAEVGPTLLPFVYLILFPAIAYISAGRTYNNSPSLLYGITYTIDENGVNCVTEGINSTISWGAFIKAKEKFGYMLLYTSSFVAHIIPLSLLSLVQADFIRQKTAKKKK